IPDQVRTPMPRSDDRHSNWFKHADGRRREELSKPFSGPGWRDHKPTLHQVVGDAQLTKRWLLEREPNNGLLAPGTPDSSAPLQACGASLPLQSFLMSETYLKSDLFVGGEIGRHRARPAGKLTDLLGLRGRSTIAVDSHGIDA